MEDLMRGLLMTGYGDENVVRLDRVPKPVANAGEVLIRVRAASVNPLDFKIRQGKLRLVRRFPLPIVMGNDFAGVVERVGEGVTRFKPSDEVYVRVNKDKLGAFAEYAVTEETNVALKPRNLSFEEAAALPLVALTAWQALHEKLLIRPGYKLFIPAGAGGVGSVAIQLAKLSGAFVATTASPKGDALVRSLGADQVIDYTKQSFTDVLCDFDGVFDLLGGESLKDSFFILKPGGKVVSIAGIPDPNTANNLGWNVLASTFGRIASLGLRRRAAKYGAEYHYLFMRPSGEQLARMAQLVESGKLRSIVDKIFPLEQGKEALAYVESRRAKGKVVIRM